MAYSIPSDRILEGAIFSVMCRNNQVRSQREMVELVNAELSKKGDYRAGGERIRRLAIDRGLVRLEIRYNELGGSDLPDVCPVCRKPMVSVRNKTLYNETVEVKRKCTACSYSVGRRRRTPGRYTFIRKRRGIRMKNWGFAKVKGTRIEIGDRLSDMMGLVEGGYVYSTLFEYGGDSPKKYEFLLSMYPQENYRTLCNITMFIDDVPGASAQAGKFLADRNVNILNSVSTEGMSNTVIVWKMLADVSFVGDMELLKERFRQLKDADDPSVDKITHLEIRPADIGRVFRNEPDMEKKELRRGTPSTLIDNTFDFSAEYGDLLGDLDGYDVLILADISSWILSVSVYKRETKLVRIEMEVPDCPGGAAQALGWVASKNINIIAVFTKIKICYQTMVLELVCDVGGCNESLDDIRKNMRSELDRLNGVYKVTKYVESSE